MIKNLIFDFGKVLVDYEYFETQDQIFKTHEQAEEFYHLLIDGKWNENMDRGDSFEETFCKMQQIMQAFRNGCAAFGGKKVLALLDYAQGLDGLPKADVLKFILEDNCSLVVRPSGTEPKLKVYTLARGKTGEECADKKERITAFARALGDAV